MNEDVKEDFEGLEQAHSDPDAVVMGDLGEEFGFAILNQAFRMVIDGAELIALQKNRFWLTPSGLSLDAGPFVAAIEYASGSEARSWSESPRSRSSSWCSLSSKAARERR